MTGTPDLIQLSTDWRTARLLYPLYAALARECVIELPPCPDLEAVVEAPEAESVEQARQWFLDMDQRIQVHQLRQFLQTTTVTNDESLRTLLQHHLQKEKLSDSDRDKIDFLLVQFFSHCAPSRLEDADVDVEYVAQMLEPVLGTFDIAVPESLKTLDALITRANDCKNLKELFTSRILEEGRKLKISAGANYFEPAAMAAFTRFSFLMRRVFFRLMHQDLNVILDGLRALEELGIYTLDCRKAQFSADEPVARLRMICQSWKVMFHAEYSSGQPLCILVDLRTAVDAALAQAAKNAAGRKASTPKAQVVAAGRGFAVSSSDAPEFEVSSAPAWDADAADGNFEDPKQ
ncbi:MAG TPA: hypothetical protein VK641_07955 [Terriglobales bacterium]|nr:hypothetical protein [Terriglobales bacterium]